MRGCQEQQSPSQPWRGKCCSDIRLWDRQGAKWACGRKANGVIICLEMTMEQKSWILPRTLVCPLEANKPHPFPPHEMARLGFAPKPYRRNNAGEQCMPSSHNSGKLTSGFQTNMSHAQTTRSRVPPKDRLPNFMSQPESAHYL